jgi:hypothetical protein
MPAALRNWPSVAPDCRIGITGTPGHIFAVSFSTGSMMARVSGGGAEFSPRISSVSTFTAGSLIALTSAWRTVSCVTPGRCGS